MVVARKDTNMAEILKELQLSHYRVPKELNGLVLNAFEDLKEKFPGNEEFSAIELHDNSLGFREYKIRNKKFDRYDFVAYGCSWCKKFIMGPPRIETESNITLLSGREGLDYYCRSCNAHIGELTTKLSFT